MSQYAPEDADPEEESYVSLIRQVPLGIIFARIIIVTCMSIAAALAIFLFVGGIWVPALVCVAATVVFLFLMFFVERTPSHIRSFLL
jgi:hypothetical protein